MSLDSNLVESPVKSSIFIEEIQTLIPHRYPMLLVDRVVDVCPPNSATGIKNVTMNEWFFEGHFPNKPVMPGVLIVEAMAQTAGILVVKSFQQRTASQVVYFMSIEEARFRRPVVPGDTMKIYVNCLKSRGKVWKFNGVVKVEDKVAAESVFTAMIADA